jgi:tripartite-type tricarboxylate transporter receptor subunit TctC
MRRLRLCAVAALAALLCNLVVAPKAHSQGYPNKPVKIVVSLAAGGLADILARVIAKQLSESSGQSVVVENRTGAAGVVGADAVAKAAPDGYTLYMGLHATNAILQHMVKLPYDPAKDFTPIVHVATFPNLLVVHPSVPAKSVAELVAYAKANAGKVTFASQGNGSTGHMAGELFKQQAGIDMVHIPYRGAAPAVQDLVAGHVQVMFDTVTLQMPNLKADKTRALAVTATERLAVVKDVPTTAEAGFPGVQIAAWFGLFAPGGTPKEVVDKVYEETKKAFAAPEVRERFLGQGALLPLAGPDDFDKHIKAERARWGDVIKKANIKLE